MTTELPAPFTSKTCITVDELALSRFVSQEYGRPWRMQQGMMLGQNTYHTVDVDASGEADGFFGETRQRLQAWLDLPVPTTDEENTRFERDHYLAVDVILSDLCYRGRIPAGDYLILVSW